MGLCQKIKTERVLADQIFMVFDKFDDETCDLTFAASGTGVNAPQISGTLLVTVTDCQLLPQVSPDDPLQVDVTLMFQKELCVTGTDQTVFAPQGLRPPFTLEFKFETCHTLTFCNITQNDLDCLGVNIEDIECELFKIVDVIDEFIWECGVVGRDEEGQLIVEVPAQIQQKVITTLKIKLSTLEQIIVALCPANHSKIKRIPRTPCTPGNGG